MYSCIFFFLSFGKLNLLFIFLHINININPCNLIIFYFSIFSLLIIISIIFLFCIYFTKKKRRRDVSTSVIHLYVNLCNSIRVFHFIIFFCLLFAVSLNFQFSFHSFLFLPSSYIDSLNDVVVVFQTLACKSEYLIYLILYVCICSSMHKRLCFIYVADADYRFDKSIFFI